MAFILSYRRPKSTFHRVLNERRRSISSTLQQHSNTHPKAPIIPVSKSALLHYSALPDWHRENVFITSHYRPESFSTISCLQSIFSIHNETVNIWTHLLPALFSLFCQIILQALLTIHFPNVTPLDRLVFATNLFALTTCLSLSTLYHTLMNHSHSVSSLWLRIDYVGILTLILGSFFSGIYVGFLCDPFLRNTYWSMIGILSTITAYLVLHPDYQSIQYRSLRTAAFILTALSGFCPIGHGMYLHGWDMMLLRSGMQYYFLEGAIYGFGAFFFVTRMPESIWPGKFNVWGGSHQIFHVLVLGGAVAHLWGVWEAYRWNYWNERGCPVI
jgi:adiponectin receptor